MSGRTGMQHLTLDTGRTRVSFRDEIAQPVLASLAPLTVTGEHPLGVPGIVPATIRVTVDGPAALVTVYRDAAPLVTFGVAADEDGAGQLWPLLTIPAEVTGPPAYRAARPSAVPWLVSRLEIGLVLHPADTAWLGDFERCWAWAWLGSRTGTEPPEKRCRG